MGDFIFLFGVLVFVHLCLDYPLQGDFMAKAKNHKNPIPGVPWDLILASHAFMHAFGVFLVTMSVFCFIAEFFSHILIDYAKSEGHIGFRTDQNIHIGLKLIYVIYLFL